MGGEVAVADGQEGNVAEVEGFEVAEALGFLLGSPEANGANAPEDADFGRLANGRTKMEEVEWDEEAVAR